MCLRWTVHMNVVFLQKKICWIEWSFTGAGKGTYKVEKIQLLSDDFGRAFREQVITYMKQKSGIGNVEELAGTTTEWEEQEKEQEVYEEEGKEVTSSLEQSL